ncbi:MAG: hypothetical protein AB8B59_14820 [Maribacter sp.]
MKNTLKTSLIILTVCITSLSSAQNTIAPEELTVLLGKWKGTLTYSNYSDGIPFSMPAELEVTKGKNQYQLELFTSYPKEPNANSKGMIKISKDGTKVNKEPITSIEQLPNERVQIITEYQGKDDGKKALIKNVYIIGKTNLIIRKEVKFDSSDTWLIRNEYSYSR